MDFQFRVAQRQDLTITFTEATQHATLHEVEHLPGVMQCQPFRSVATRLRHGHRERRIGIMGLPEQGDLYRVLDTDEHQVTIPEEGILLSDKLARVLEISPGSLIDVEVLEGKRGRYQVPVAGVVQEYNGMNAYMNLSALNRLIHEGAVISGAFVKNGPCRPRRCLCDSEGSSTRRWCDDQVGRD